MKSPWVVQVQLWSNCGAYSYGDSCRCRPLHCRYWLCAIFSLHNLYVWKKNRVASSNLAMIQMNLGKRTHIVHMLHFQRASIACESNPSSTSGDQTVKEWTLTVEVLEQLRIPILHQSCDVHLYLVTVDVDSCVKHYLCYILWCSCQIWLLAVPVWQAFYHHLGVN